MIDPDRDAPPASARPAASSGAASRSACRSRAPRHRRGSTVPAWPASTVIDGFPRVVAVFSRYRESAGSVGRSDEMMMWSRPKASTIATRRGVLRGAAGLRASRSTAAGSRRCRRRGNRSRDRPARRPAVVIGIRRAIGLGAVRSPGYIRFMFLPSTGLRCGTILRERRHVDERHDDHRAGRPSSRRSRRSAARAR